MATTRSNKATEEQPVAESMDNEHTAGGVVTRDSMDAGVPMMPGDPREPIGPEDAMGPGPKRGDYSDRVHRGPHMVTVENPDADVDAGEPRFLLVDQEARAEEQGDEEGKGGTVQPAASNLRAIDLPPKEGEARAFNPVGEQSDDSGTSPSRSSQSKDADK